MLLLLLPVDMLLHTVLLQEVMMTLVVLVVMPLLLQVALHL
jgi:hypothetical protein